jgi:protein-tyrosine phosphatase
MIDTHCHLLPGLDDGPATLEGSLELARELVASSVETVVCTPHWSRSFPTRHGDVLVAADRVRDAIQVEDLPLQLVVAAELSDVVAATRPLPEIGERAIAGRSVVVELGPDSLPVQTAAIVNRLRAAGLTTVIAHPERCRAVQEDSSVLDRLRLAGAHVQVVAPSLTGSWGDRVRATAWTLLDTGRADLVASDAHGAATRPCELREAESLVVARLGREHWDDLTWNVPRRLLVGAAAPV